MVHESGGENLQKGGLWDPSLDATSFLEKTLLLAEAMVELDNLREEKLPRRKLPRPLQAYDREGLGWGISS